MGEQQPGGKSVFELSMDGDEPPQSYVHEEDDRPSEACPPTSPIPFIDLHLLLSSGPSKEAEMEKLRSSLQTWGFLQAINHGISSSLLNTVSNVGKEFFHLPKQEKEKYSNQAYGKDKDGLENIENVSENEILDWNEQLYLLMLPEDERKLERWPETPISFREILHEYSMKIKEVIHLVLGAMANLVDLKEDYFMKQFDNGAKVYGRFNYYPPCSRPDLVFGIKSHSDGSGITILLPDPAVEGLEIFKDNQWVKVPPVPNTLLINVGDQMEIMSNGIFRSPVHRVVANSKEERVSLAMFLAADVEKEIGPADELVNSSRPRSYKTVKVQDYLDVFLRCFTEGKRAIDWAKA